MAWQELEQDLLRIYEVLDCGLSVHTVYNIFWNDGHIPSTIANASSLSCVNSYINMGVSFRCGGCPSRHKVLQLDVVD